MTDAALNTDPGAPPPQAQPLSTGLATTATVIYLLLVPFAVIGALGALFGVGLIAEGGEIGAGGAALIAGGILLALAPITRARDRHRSARIAAAIPVPVVLLGIVAAIYAFTTSP